MSPTSFLKKVLRRVSRQKRTSNVEIFTASRAMGWAVDPRNASKPATLTLFVDGRPKLNIAANQSRADVMEAGKGPLHCGFNVQLPKDLRDGKAHLVELRFDKGGPQLWGGELRIAGTEAIRPAETAKPEAAGGRDMAAREQAETDDADETEDKSEESEGAAEKDGAAEEPALEPLRAVQGVAYLDRRRLAIAGWAMGCTEVYLRLDDEAEVLLPLDQSVPGLGAGLHYGFLYPLPAAFMDGTAHRAEVRFAIESRPETAPLAESKLDGSPVHFCLTPADPIIEVVSLVGQSLRLRARDQDGTPIVSPLGLTADGMAVALHREDDRVSRGLYSAHLPQDCREICLFDESSHPPVPLGRYWITQGNLLAQAAVLPKLAPAVLTPANYDAAKSAFAAFCAAPDRRFDPLWYSQTYGVPVAEALAHYRDQGAISGHSPGPFFDESAARQSQSALAQALAEGHLPCAFALELALGVGQVATLPMASPDLTRAVAQLPLVAAEQNVLTLMQEFVAPTETAEAAALPKPLAAKLPAPSTELPPSQSIYAAWLARLDLTPEQRAEIETDEHRMRQKIEATSLADQPLVSIIMPSFNRAYTIGEAIQSVLEQSYQNWELLVCDDASEDKTPEVLRGFDDPRIRYMKFTKSNGAATRNKGLRFAKGTYIAYLDSDNIWHPQFLDLMLRALLSVPGTAIAYGAYLDTEIRGASVVLDKIGRSPFRPIQLSSRNFMDLNTILHHRQVYDWMGGFDESLPRLQDWDLMLRYTSIFQPLYVNHVGVFYRRNVAWGQVTHLFTGSGAQDNVNEKTNRRLTQAHERLAIQWPARGRVTVLLYGPNPGDRLLAESLARLACGVADVDFLDLSGAPERAVVATADPQGLSRHVVPAALVQDWYRLCHALPHLLRDQPVLTVAAPEAELATLPIDARRKVYLLRKVHAGLVLRSLLDPEEMFYLGALPLETLMPRPEPSDEAAAAARLFLVPGGKRSSTSTLISQAKARGLSVLLPPNSKATGGWQLISGGEVEVLPHDAWASALSSCTLAASLLPMSAVSALAFSVLTGLQGQGVPLAVPQENRRPDALANQWLEARGAYDVKVDTPQWLFDKLSKLQGDPQSYGLLADRGKRVHQIYLHPELTQERLAFALYRMLFAPSSSERLNVQP